MHERKATNTAPPIIGAGNICILGPNASQAFDIFFFVTGQKRFIRLKKDKKIKPSQSDNKALTCLAIIAHEGLIEVT